MGGVTSLLYLLLLVPSFSTATAREETLYDILKLKRGATAKEIRSAYHRLALELHPDKSGGGKDASRTERFIRVSEAYSVLSDPGKRRAYDRSMPGARRRSGGSSGRSRGGGSSYGNQQFTFTFNLNDAQELMRKFTRENPELHGVASRLAQFVNDNLYVIPGAAAAAAVLSQQQHAFLSAGADALDWNKLERAAKSLGEGVKSVLTKEDGSVHWGRVAAVGAATTAAVASALDAFDDGNRTHSVVGQGREALRKISGWFGFAQNLASPSTSSSPDGKSAGRRSSRKPSRDEL